jgi:hypothetical protein
MVHLPTGKQRKVQIRAQYGTTLLKEVRIIETGFIVTT